MSVTVKWGKDRLALALPPPDTTLAVIRQSLADYTQLSAFKLIHKGTVLKNDTATLAECNIGPGSVLVLIPTGGDACAPTAPAEHGITSEESALLASISSELANVRSSLAPQLADLPPDKKHELRLGELLLQSLIRLDALGPEREWEQARQARKDAVREVQALLDSLDDTIASRKSESVDTPL